MAFRTLEISSAADIHIKEGQLEINSEQGTIRIPVEDLSLFMAHGANIRLSTMDLSILSQNKIAVMTLDEKYLPTAIVLPFEGNSRQSQLMHAQVEAGKAVYRGLWHQIMERKIMNQAKCLNILGKEGQREVEQFAEQLTENNLEVSEALAAKFYFSCYHEGLNRRTEDPLNSRLNYGYAVVRGAIARSLVSAGFHPTFGIHHNSQLNTFNLADDLIEPYRAIVDLTAYNLAGSNEKLNKNERRALAHVLYNACMADGKKVNIMTSIEWLCESLKRNLLENSEEHLVLPEILPVESLEAITE